MDLGKEWVYAGGYGSRQGDMNLGKRTRGTRTDPMQRDIVKDYKDSGALTRTSRTDTEEKCFMSGIAMKR